MKPLRDQPHRTVSLVALTAIAMCGVPRTATAEDIWPYRAVVLEPIPYFTDPQIDPELTRTPGLSYVRLSRELFRMLDEDPRFGAAVSETYAAPVLLQDEQLALTFANEHLELGIAAFSRYEIGTAIDHLEAAVVLFREASAQATNPRDVATAHQYLGRAYLERANIEPDRSAPLIAEARSHFREMIRHAPNVDIREGLFPEVVVDQFHQAYAELLNNNGAGLRLTDGDVATLSRRYGADVLVHPYAIRDADGRRLVIEVYDDAGVTGADMFRAVVPLAPDTEASLELVNRFFSQYLACIPLRYEPTPPPTSGDAHHLFLSAGWSAGVYGESPIDHRFLNQGVSLMVDYQVTDHLGLFGRANVMFSSADSEGDLLSSFTSTRTALGIAFSGRFKRFRAFLGTGLEVNFVGSVTASDDFWCKVSGGRPETFGVGQDCLPSEVTNQDAATLVGPYLMPGVSIDIVNPFSAYALGSFSFYINSRTALDFPMGGELGLQYRF